jgi:hypothetical protein
MPGLYQAGAPRSTGAQAMAIPLDDKRNSSRLLAERLDELTGLVAVLMAHAALNTSPAFTESDFKAMKAAAERMVREQLGRSATSAPKPHASQNADLLWAMIKTLRSHRPRTEETGA